MHFFSLGRRAGTGTLLGFFEEHIGTEMREHKRQSSRRECGSNPTASHPAEGEVIVDQNKNRNKLEKRKVT